MAICGNVCRFAMVVVSLAIVTDIVLQLGGPPGRYTKALWQSWQIVNAGDQLVQECGCGPKSLTRHSGDEQYECVARCVALRELAAAELDAIATELIAYDDNGSRKPMVSEVPYDPQNDPDIVKVVSEAIRKDAERYAPICGGASVQSEQQ